MSIYAAEAAGKPFILDLPNVALGTPSIRVKQICATLFLNLKKKSAKGRNSAVLD